MTDRSSSSLAGIGCMVGGTLLLTLHDAVAKWMTGSYTVGEVMCYRSLFAIFILGVALRGEGGWAAFRPKAIKATGARAILATLTSFLVVASYAVLPLADALAIIFSSPIFLTALAIPLLGERVGWRRWSAVLVGFVGILIMVNPSAAGVTAGALTAVAAALCAALRDIVTRRIGTTDSATNVLFYTTLVSFVVGLGFIAVRASGWPSLTDWGFFALAGVLSTGAHWLVIRSFQLAEAATVGPLRYLAIVYAAVVGFIVFGEVPGSMQILGAAIVVLAALYIMQRERRGAR